jgi:threonine synthase
MTSTSTANGQKCLYCGARFPLYPPITTGCPACVTDRFKSPLELTYDYPKTADWLPEWSQPGLNRYAAVLPPLVESLSMGEGGTPLIRYSERVASDVLELYIKDESRNPTWSHKDRLNLMVISAALTVGARGVVAASSGNHGASAAAYSARAGLPGVILTTPRPPAVASFLQAYGQLVVAVPSVEIRWKLMERLVNEMGYHPSSNQTVPPTNHPFGSEGYKTIAYEVYQQLGRRAPEAVFVPVGYGELIFGIYKGFAELKRYGLIETLPRMMGCEPAAGAPLKRALDTGQPVAYVNGDIASEAYSIAVPVNSYRGVVAIRETNGDGVPVSEDEIRRAQAALSRAGMWAELSSTVAFAGALRARELGIGRRGPIVSINTSSGFKDISVGTHPVPQIDGSWEALRDLMAQCKLV